MTPFVVLCPKNFSISVSNTSPPLPKIKKEERKENRTHLLTIPHQKPHTPFISSRERTARTRLPETEVVAWDYEEESGGEGFDYGWGEVCGEK